MWLDDPCSWSSRKQKKWSRHSVVMLERVGNWEGFRESRQRVPCSSWCVTESSIEGRCYTDVCAVQMRPSVLISHFDGGRVLVLRQRAYSAPMLLSMSGRVELQPQYCSRRTREQCEAIMKVSVQDLCSPGSICHG